MFTSDNNKMQAWMASNNGLLYKQKYTIDFLWWFFFYYSLRNLSHRICKWLLCTLSDFADCIRICLSSNKIDIWHHQSSWHFCLIITTILKYTIFQAWFTEPYLLQFVLMCQQQQQKCITYITWFLKLLSYVLWNEP